MLLDQVPQRMPHSTKDISSQEKPHSIGGIPSTNPIWTNGMSNGNSNGIGNGTSTSSGTTPSANPALSRATTGLQSPTPQTQVNGVAQKGFVGAVDQGTTSSRFIIFDPRGEIVVSHQIEFNQIYPQPGWHEHDPEELLASVEACIDGAAKDFVSQGHSPSDVASIGITNQRETTVVWDTETGKPLYNAIVWTDTRTRDMVRKLKDRIGSSELHQRCGLPLSTYPSAGKLLWMVDNVPAVAEAYAKGTLAMGTIDSWLIYKLNGGVDRNVHVTDPSNASRTMLMNLETRQYDEALIDWFRLDRKNVILPKIVPSSDPEAYGSLATTALKGVKIGGCIGDQTAALLGQKAFAAGQAKNTYGTGCFLLYNVGNKPVISAHGLLSTVVCDLGKGKVIYGLEGSIAVAGSSVKFLQNNLGFIDENTSLAQLAESVEDNGGCTFVTAFSGLFAPYWIDDARGTIFGITAFTQRGHIARATLEATCFQTKAILDAMAKDSGQPLAQLSVDGGMCKSDLIMQTQSDIISIPVNRPAMRETTALGAAIAAGMAVGLWSGYDELKYLNNDEKTVFEPQITGDVAATRFERWERAVQMCRGWLS